MRIKLLILIGLSAGWLHAKPIDQLTLDIIIAIGKEAGVPKSVVVQLQIEESGDYKTGTYGTPKAQSIVTNGYRSKGLFQLYTKPSNINELLNKFWYAYEEDHWEKWDICNPIHNAKVALRYVAALHRQYGSWYRALLFYNSGSIKYAPEETKQYARRIVNAK